MVTCALFWEVQGVEAKVSSITYALYIGDGGLDWVMDIVVLGGHIKGFNDTVGGGVSLTISHLLFADYTLVFVM